MAYDVYSDFELSLHMDTFVNYLEVMIDPAGVIHYAVPSHQEYAIEQCCRKLYVSREKLAEMTPPEWYGDWLKWLLGECDHVAVWNEFCCYKTINDKQLDTLKKLQEAGLYRCDLKSI